MAEPSSGIKSKSDSDRILSEHVLPLETPLIPLKIETAFNGLSDKERLYAHHLTRASHWSSFIIMDQTSPETGPIFSLLMDLFSAQPLGALKLTAEDRAAFTDQDWAALTTYASGILYNLGNYLGFGDRKIIPGFEASKFEALVRSSKACIENPGIVDYLRYLPVAYDVAMAQRYLGLAPNGRTMYFSPNMTLSDSELVQRFMANKGIEPWNTRAIKRLKNGPDSKNGPKNDNSGPKNDNSGPDTPKTDKNGSNMDKNGSNMDNSGPKTDKNGSNMDKNGSNMDNSGPDDYIYEIKIASIDSGPLDGLTTGHEVFEGHNMSITRGDHSYFLSKVVSELREAQKYSGDKVTIEMLDKYIESFTTGSIQAHKDGSAKWVDIKGPSVENYIGFIEVYRDPTNQRAEFESFVAIKNAAQSAKFDQLVDMAPSLLPKLPWGANFEEDKFIRPDFTALDILAFATSGLPIGINIPNYKDIKAEYGHKNVSLTNVMAARTAPKFGPFLHAQDSALREKHGPTALEIQVGLHELLGHGCGKLFRAMDTSGALNFDPKLRDPISGGPVGYYGLGETYNTRFAAMASAYEECRAETVAIYLGLDDSVLDVFNIQQDDRSDLKYVMWLDMFYAGLRGLEMYQINNHKWGQAHSQARFAILNVGLECGVAKITEIVDEDGLPDLLLSVDREKIETVGREAMGEFLKRLQIFRSMGDNVRGSEHFLKYSDVEKLTDYPYLQWHEIVVRKRPPRAMLCLANTVRKGDNVEIVTYPEGPECIIQSWLDRFTQQEYQEIYKELLKYSQNWTK